MSQVDIYRDRMDPTPRMRERWARVEKAGDKITLSDHMRAAKKHCNGLDPIVWGNGCIAWSSPETPEEVQARIDAAQDGLDKHLAAIKGMHDAYTELGYYDAAHRTTHPPHDAEMAAARDADRVARVRVEGEAS